MKYIRTKDEIYEREQTLPTGTIFNANCLYTDNELIYDVRTGFGIIAQADTIEELCDEFVVFGDIDRPYLTRHKFTNKEWNKQYFIGDRKLYGAIWTDKGLIYVAKMNDEGELELI